MIIRTFDTSGKVVSEQEGSPQELADFLKCLMEIGLYKPDKNDPPKPGMFG